MSQCFSRALHPIRVSAHGFAHSQALLVRRAIKKVYEAFYSYRFWGRGCTRGLGRLPPEHPEAGPGLREVQIPASQSLKASMSAFRCCCCCSCYSCCFILIRKQLVSDLVRQDTSSFCRNVFSKIKTILKQVFDVYHTLSLSRLRIGNEDSRPGIEAGMALQQPDLYSNQIPSDL